MIGAIFFKKRTDCGANGGGRDNEQWTMSNEQGAMDKVQWTMTFHYSDKNLAKIWQKMGVSALDLISDL